MPFLFSTHFTITSLNREFSGQSIGFALGAVCKKMSTVNVRVEHIYILYVIWNFQDTHMSALPARESREGFKGKDYCSSVNPVWIKTKTVKTLLCGSWCFQHPSAKHHSLWMQTSLPHTLWYSPYDFVREPHRSKNRENRVQSKACFDYAEVHPVLHEVKIQKKQFPLASHADWGFWMKDVTTK